MKTFSNNGQTVLNQDITNVATSFTVRDGSVFPSTGSFFILIDSEIIQVTNVTGNTITVVRGQQATTNVAHVIGATISLVLSKTDCESFQKLTGTYVARPSAGNEGRRYYCNDSPMHFYDDGTIWRARMYGFEVKEFSDSGFSWANQGGATLDELDRGYASLFVPGNVVTSLRMRVKTAPTAPYTFKALFSIFHSTTASQIGGLIVRDSVSAKLIVFGFNHNGVAVVNKYDNESSFNSAYTTTVTTFIPGFNLSAAIWIRIRDNATTRFYEMSMDNQHWLTIHSAGRTDFVTPNQIGFAGSSGSSLPFRVNFYSWEES
jgi:hypothetical protein